MVPKRQVLSGKFARHRRTTKGERGHARVVAVQMNQAGLGGHMISWFGLLEVGVAVQLQWVSGRDNFTLLC